MADRSHGDRVRAVLARTDLPVEERRWRAAAIRALAHRNDPSTPTDGDPIPLAWQDDELYIAVEFVEYDAAKNLLRVFLAAFRQDGSEVDTLSLPYEYVNPPMGYLDDDDNVVEDVAAAFKAIVTNTVRRQA